MLLPLLLLFCTATLGGHFDKPIMGWSTWCTNKNVLPCYDDWCTSAEIKQVATSMMHSGLLAAGYDMIQLDDCWASVNRSSTGEIQADASRFPEGMQALASWLHSRGFKLGLYTDIGPTTCRGGRAGSWPHYQQDAQTFKKWGVDLIKQDWCHHPGGYTAQQLYSNMSSAIASAYGDEPYYFSLCEWGLFKVWEWAPSISNAWRVGPDHLPVWWTPATSQDPGEGQGTANIIQHMAGLSKYVSPGHYNDPDFLMTGEWWESEAEDITEFSFWALLAAPLIVATDVRKGMSGRKNILLNKDIISISQDPLVIAGDLRVNRTDGCQIWSRPLTGPKWAVIVYNSHVILKHTKPIDVVFSDTVLPGWTSNHSALSVRNAWTGSIQNASKSFTVESLKPRHSQTFILSI